MAAQAWRCLRQGDHAALRVALAGTEFVNDIILIDDVPERLEGNEHFSWGEIDALNLVGGAIWWLAHGHWHPWAAGDRRRGAQSPSKNSILKCVVVLLEVGADGSAQRAHGELQNIFEVASYTDELGYEFARELLRQGAILQSLLPIARACVEGWDGERSTAPCSARYVLMHAAGWHAHVWPLMEPRMAARAREVGTAASLVLARCLGLHATSDTVKLLVACQVVPLVLCVEFGPL